MVPGICRVVVLTTFLSFACACSSADEPPSKDLNSFQAAYFGELETLKLMLKKNPGLVKDTNRHGETLLHRAAEGNHPVIVRYLVKQGADIEAKTYWGFSKKKVNKTPLHFAAEHGTSFEAANVLIELGADVNARPKYTTEEPSQQPGKTLKITSYGYSVLEMAALSGDYRLVDLLIQKGAKVPEETPSTMNALHYACYGTRQSKNPKYPENVGNRKVIALLSKHIDINSKTRGGKKTPLHYAVGSGAVETVKYLVSNYKNIDLNDGDVEGNTALHIAVIAAGRRNAQDHAEIIKTLIEAGADVTRQNSKGFTPKELAEESGKTALIDAFK